MSDFKLWNLSQNGIAFDPQTGETYQLNDAATLFLKFFRQGKSVEDAAREVSTMTGIPYEKALTDAMEFHLQLGQLSAA